MKAVGLVRSPKHTSKPPNSSKAPANQIRDGKTAWAPPPPMPTKKPRQLLKSMQRKCESRNDAQQRTSIGCPRSLIDHGSPPLRQSGQLVTLTREGLPRTR